MRIRQYKMGLLGAMGLALLAGPVAAQHVDIEAELEGGQFVLDNESGPSAPISSAVVPGLKIFESEFGELGNDFATEDPGFEVPDGSGNPGELVALRIEHTLRKWDGAAWIESGFDEFFTIVDALSNEVDVSATGITGTNTSIIDQLDSGGGLHSHVEFEIGTTAAGDPMDGAYLVELSMFGLESDQVTPVYTPSDNFLIVFHLDAGGTFDEDAFEASVDALAPVPIPAAVYLFGGAVALLSGFRRRQQLA